jgi:hypothetical protein
VLRAVHNAITFAVTLCTTHNTHPSHYRPYLQSAAFVHCAVNSLAPANSRASPLYMLTTNKPHRVVSNTTLRASRRLYQLISLSACPLFKYATQSRSSPTYMLRAFLPCLKKCCHPHCKRAAFCLGSITASLPPCVALQPDSFVAPSPTRSCLGSGTAQSRSNDLHAVCVHPATAGHATYFLVVNRPMFSCQFPCALKLCLANPGICRLAALLRHLRNPGLLTYAHTVSTCLKPSSALFCYVRSIQAQTV